MGAPGCSGRDPKCRHPVADAGGSRFGARKLRINNANEVNATVGLLCPGEVTGLDPQQIVRAEPKPGNTTFESNFLAAIEFDRPDLPWLFTPAKADANGRLRPWLCLAVVKKQRGVSLRSDRAVPLAILEIGLPAKPADELPDLAESWAWSNPISRTNFLDEASLLRAEKIIEDYAETAGAMREIATRVSYKQPGDPVKLAAAIVRLAASPSPPVHLPLGNDTLKHYREKTEAFEKEIAEWHDVITSTDHDDVVAH